ncbi:hypothetical protein PJK45_11305 [Mycobacterium kansasii]|uniref:hypothetical protein n=1 Tax=Mycobacterium kansasii TaxID=1768 RepID=UPI0002EA29A0|nr:hypothetical protein [Mycobacterium kansasii]ARG58195.1 hypothetical protein B1T43_22790 [Mycobacterium kansasii]ARG63709.1 hypothetical protein B1T45_23335 [Mycobacterium kansasii]ARG71355.1 hypothetical protein B1T47_22665 [Mycobacterium kansasii]ARG74131.1 hypothetical protein B1T51_06055 [Mycobacterium kansasii]ARG79554.1 hypothetical protein B1T52_05950 [Mycobacterium kansasii]
MARRRSRPIRQQPVAPSPIPRRVETGPDGYDYEVRAIAAARALKTYRCPGCDHEIRSGTAHVVVWPAEKPEAVEDRRHWHTPCWANRSTRGPTRKWS